MTIQQSCKDDSDPISLLCEEIIGRILESVSSLARTEMMPIRQTLQQVTFYDIIVAANVPPQKKFIMNGCAFRQEELEALNDRLINRISTSFAGDNYSFYQFNSETL